MRMMRYQAYHRRRALPQARGMGGLALALRAKALEHAENACEVLDPNLLRLSDARLAALAGRIF